jgi:glycerol kinase
LAVLLGIDVGTSGARAIAFDERGRVLASRHREYGIHRPGPGAAEQDWPVLERAMLRCLEGVRLKLGRRTGDLAGVAVTNQRETFVPLDARGKPVGRAIVWQDSRSVRECALLERRVGQAEAHRRTGLRIHTYFTAPKLMWLERNRPSVWARARRFALVHDLAAMRLCGNSEPVTDPSNASRTLLWNLARGAWDARMLEAAGVPEALLPDVVECGDAIADLALHGWPSAPVLAGGGDQQCAALGVGVVKPGLGKATFGTGSFLMTQTRGPRLDPLRRAITTRHCVPGEFAVEVSQFSAGTSLRWVRDHLYRDMALRAGAYSLICADAARASDDRPHFLPYVSGAGAPHWSSGARGALASLTLAHGRREIARAVLEGVAREAAGGASLLRRLGCRRLVIDGGLSRAPLFAGTFAALSPLAVSRSRVAEATSLGAAIIAAVGAGVHRSFGRASREMVRSPAPVPVDRTLRRRLALKASDWERWSREAVKAAGVGE